MKKTKVFIIALISMLVLGAAVFPAAAQSQSPVTIELDRTSVTTDETLALTIGIDVAAGQASEPQLPVLDGLDILGRSSGTQIQMINGNTQMRSTYQYTLRPTKTGTLIIEPINITVNGQIYTSEAINIQVTQGTGQVQPAPNVGMPTLPGFPNIPSLGNLPGFPAMPGLDPVEPVDPAEAPTELIGQDFFVEAEVDKLNPYQGEQITFTFRFYQAENLYDQPGFEPPAFTGFWSEQMPDQVEYTTQAAGRNYRVTELQTVLFPTVVDQLTIEPAALTIPGGFFSRPQALRTQPITLDVRPLPAGAPADFQGAVGQFAIQAKVDKAEVEVNDTLTMGVTLSGFGNIETLPEPAWDAGAAWRAFDSQVTVETQIVDGKMGGAVNYERLLVPTTPGNQTLPAITTSFFNPETETYETISADPFIISVMGAVGNGQAQVAPAAGSAVNPAVPAAANSELRANKPATAVNASSTTPLTGNGLYWLLFSLPLLLLVGAVGWSHYKQHRSDNAGMRRSQQAARKAQQALIQSRKNPANANAVAGHILTTYLAEKLNRPVSGLTQQSLASLLAARGVDETLVERVHTCLALSEMGNYAPTGLTANNNDLITETEQVITALEEALV